MLLEGGGAEQSFCMRIAGLHAHDCTVGPQGHVVNVARGGRVRSRASACTLRGCMRAHDCIGGAQRQESEKLERGWGGAEPLHASQVCCGPVVVGGLLLKRL